MDTGFHCNWCNPSHTVCDNQKNSNRFEISKLYVTVYGIRKLVCTHWFSFAIDHFHNDVKQSLKARRNIEYEKGDVPNSVCIGNCFEAEIRIQI